MDDFAKQSMTALKAGGSPETDRIAGNPVVELCRACGRYAPVLLSREGIATIATGLLALLSWLSGLIGVGPGWLPLALGLSATGIGGSLIVVGAIRGLLAGELNVDELVSIALIASVLAGEVLSAALVAFMMLAGKVLEDLTAHRAAHALENLGRLVPALARVRRPAGVEELVPVDALRPGDAVVVRPGERIPVDGVVLSGQAAVDQAPITGESVPVEKTPGREVYAGTLTAEGALVVETVRAGETTALGRIGVLVAQAQEERAPIVRMADRFARFFTPLVLGLTALTYVATGQVTSAIAVLVVACPCALVLATPTAVIAGVAAGARRGLVIRGGARLEQAGRVDVVCFDKTGTLTLGAPQVSRIVPLAGQAEGAVLALAAAAEQYSEHPLARAIVSDAGAAEVALDAPPVGFRSWPGRGVIATVGDRQVAVGTGALLTDLAIAVDREAAAARSAIEQQGETAVFVAVDDRVAGVLGIVDAPRPGVRGTIAALRAAGVRRLVMLTGDNPTVAAAVAKAAGVDEVHAGLLPEEKVARVRQLQAEGHRVAMVGDGVNDAPALAAADIAIVMGATGADVALELADIALMTNELPRAADAVLLSRQTLGLIRQNLGFALVWNVVAVLAAGTGLLSPIAGALVHNVGSVAVTVNAARLAGWKPGSSAGD